MPHNESSKEHAARDRLVKFVELGVLAAGAYRLMRHHEDAEDLLQDTYERALKGIYSFKGESELKTWLTRIMINRAKDIRALARQGEVPTDMDNYEMPYSKSPEDVVLERDAAQQVLGELSSLSGPQQKTLILRAHGLSDEEMSVLLSMPVGTIKSHYHRGRDAFQANHEAS